MGGSESSCQLIADAGPLRSPFGHMTPSTIAIGADDSFLRSPDMKPLKTLLMDTHSWHELRYLRVTQELSANSTHMLYNHGQDLGLAGLPWREHTIDYL